MPGFGHVPADPSCACEGTGRRVKHSYALTLRPWSYVLASPSRYENIFAMVVVSTSYTRCPCTDRPNPRRIEA